MANRIGGRPDKKRLLPGVGYPIPISPAAAPSGGFASPVLLWPYGFGEATTAALTLSQSGSIGITGTTSVTGNLAWALSITQSGQVSVSGAITTSGNLVLDIGIGGTIPLVSMLADLFPQAEVVVTGVGDPTSHIHGPDESQDLEELRRSILDTQQHSRISLLSSPCSFSCASHSAAWVAGLPGLRGMVLTFI